MTPIVVKLKAFSVCIVLPYLPRPERGKSATNSHDNCAQPSDAAWERGGGGGAHEWRKRSQRVSIFVLSRVQEGSALPHLAACHRAAMLQCRKRALSRD